jgi:hypothetical protein
MNYAIEQLLGKRIIRVVTDTYNSNPDGWTRTTVHYIKQLWFEDGSFLDFTVESTGVKYPETIVGSTFNPSQLSGDLSERG